MSSVPADAGTVHTAPTETIGEAATWAASRRRGIIVTTVVASLIAATFYVGFIVMMVLRAIH
jgi:predicted secreted protein